MITTNGSVVQLTEVLTDTNSQVTCNDKYVYIVEMNVYQD